MKSRFLIIAVLITAAAMLAFAEIWTITGKVTDLNNMPLPGVSVTLNGSSQGTITDQDGNYSITTDTKDGKLKFSYIGYATIEEKIKGRSVINVKMAEEKISLNEIVVNSFGIQRDEVYYEQENAAPMLQGRVAGISLKSSGKSYNTESYASVKENGYKSVKHDPLSTFSIDVDNASYSNIRRFINQGEIPPPDVVRIEEMINYFHYDYPEVSGEHPFSVTTELSVCPWEKRHILLHVGLQGKAIEKESFPPSNIVFLIDVSGSMDEPDKLPLLKSGLSLLVKELRPEDHVAIVTYAGSAGLALNSTPGNRKETILRAIDNLSAGGSTAGGAGLKLAYEEADQNFLDGGNNRIILATDGDFNVGQSSNEAMEKLIESERRKGIFITVLGFGMGNIQDDKMEIIADKGNGNYYYIDNLQEARKVLVREFGGTLFTIAKDVKFQIEFNPEKIKSYRLIGYENRVLNDVDFNNDKKDAGEMGSGHTVTALYELTPSGSDDNGPSVDPLKYGTADKSEKSKSDYSDEYLTIKIRYKKPDSATSRLLEKVVRGPVNPVNSSSENMRFAAAVAEFGMILQESEFTGKATLESAATLARSARGQDEDGYRAEFIRLVKTVQDMKDLSDRE
jgi:Ca-activated chloride channel family protein